MIVIMDDWDSLHAEIVNNMLLKTTEELRSILEEHDREAWSDDAFEVVREILVNRTGEVPQISVQQEGLPGNLEHWKSINWKKVYSKSQRQLEGRINFAIAVLAIIFVLFLLFALSIASLALELGAILFLLLLGLLRWILLRRIRQQENRLILEARVYLKSINLLNRNEINWVEINILNAFTITPDGQILDAKDWTGYKKVLFSNKLYDDVQEQDKVNLLCRPQGFVLGKVEDFLDQ
jgi:hypothetical protein